MAWPILHTLYTMVPSTLLPGRPPVMFMASTLASVLTTSCSISREYGAVKPAPAHMRRGQRYPEPGTPLMGEFE